MKIRDDLNDTIEAPPRNKPGALPEVGRIVTLRKRHMELVEELQKALDKREEILAKLMREQTRIKLVRLALGRSTKNIDKARKDAARPNTMPDDPVYRRVR